MASDKIDNTIFLIILQMHKSNTGADVDSIHKYITKTADYENITKEFLDDRIYNPNC